MALPSLRNFCISRASCMDQFLIVMTVLYFCVCVCLYICLLFVYVCECVIVFLSLRALV